MNSGKFTYIENENIWQVQQHYNNTLYKAHDLSCYVYLFYSFTFIHKEKKIGSLLHPLPCHVQIWHKVDAKSTNLVVLYMHTNTCKYYRDPGLYPEGCLVSFGHPIADFGCPNNHIFCVLCNGMKINWTPNSPQMCIFWTPNSEILAEALLGKLSILTIIPSVTWSDYDDLVKFLTVHSF